jgi:hypothetical protein
MFGCDKTNIFHFSLVIEKTSDKLGEHSIKGWWVNSKYLFLKFLNDHHFEIKLYFFTSATLHHGNEKYI